MANPKLPPALKYFREGFRPLTVAPTAGRPIRRMLPWSTCGHTQGLVRIAPAKQYRLQLHVTTNDAAQWRAATGVQIHTDAQSARPLKQPGSAFSCLNQRFRCFVGGDTSRIGINSINLQP